MRTQDPMPAVRPLFARPDPAAAPCLLALAWLVPDCPVLFCIADPNCDSSLPNQPCPVA